MSSYGRQAGIYDAEYRDYHGDIDFYLDRLHRDRVRGAVLDCGCGTGRVAIPLARSGFRVTGIDRSMPMLRRAWRHRSALAAEVALRLRFSLQDMESFAFKSPFGAAVIAFSTFNMLTDPVRRRACLDRIRAQLDRGGLLLLDLIATGQSPAAARRFSSTFVIPPRAEVVHKLVEERNDGPSGLTRIVYRYDVRRYADDRQLDSFDVEFEVARIGRGEVENELYGAGFDVEEVFGDYRGNPLRPNSPRMVVQARSC